MRRKIYLLLLGVVLSVSAMAQSQLGEIRGTVFDENTKEALYSANVVAYQGGQQITGAATDIDGVYKIKGLKPGTYDIIVKYTGYNTKKIEGLLVRPDQITFQDVQISEAINLTDEIVITEHARTPIVKGDELGRTIDNAQKIPIRSVNGLSNTVAGTLSLDGGTPSFRGARTSGTAYYIDGVRVIGNINFPQSGIGQTNVITGGVSAEYGDFVGGAISITTPPPSGFSSRHFEAITSSLFDKYHYNLVEMQLTGPVITKNKGRSNSRTVLGYSFAGNFRYEADPSPSAIGIWRVKEDKLKQLEADPIRSSPIGQGYVPNAEFITQSDLEKVQARPNTPLHVVSTIGNLNFAPTDKIQIILGAKYDYTNSIGNVYGNSLFNFNSNPQSIQHSLLSYLSFTQRLVTSEDNKDKNVKRLVESAYYTIRLEYQSNWNISQDAVHKDNIFDYGYIGRFKTFSTPAFEFVGNGNENSSPDTIQYNGQTYYVKNYYRQSGNRPIDTLFTFDRSNTRNPIRANYTSTYYDLLGQNNIRSIFDVRSSNAGLVNGQNPIGIYSQMWNNVGALSASYAKSQNEQYSLNASGEVSIKGHDIKFGIYYEQRVSRSYSVDGNSLWTLMWQLMNNGIELDKSNPIAVVDENGIFKDTVRYNYTQNESQSTFDKNFRKRLIERGITDNYGNPITENSIVDINSFDPNDFKLSDFSANELLNNGNSLVSYYGYDYLGNKIKGNTGIADFLDPTKRQIGAYMPLYSAVYVQDKFAFKDLIFRLGLRVERFDNNLSVLKDPFSLYPVRTAGEVKEIGGSAVTHPSSVGSNYAVYVDNVENPTKILGYRNGLEWFNKDGIKIADPSPLANNSKTGKIQPYLVDANNQNVTAASFTDYKPIINVLPRVWFDFPINTASRFFASYDVIAQRPSNVFTTVSDYYYLRFNPTTTLNNPNLKSQLTTDYEIGFKQRLTDNTTKFQAALSLVASYREQRNLIQLYRYNYAYPTDYTSFGNIDFSTIKSFRLEYEMRELGNLNMDANYTLMFADGTGSSTGSQAALISVGLPNLRTLFPLNVDVRHNLKLNIYYEFKDGDDYDGPVWGKTKVFENAGFSAILNAFSGLPYTAQSTATPDAQSGIVLRSPIKGTPFGSRLPWQLQNDINVYKYVNVKLGRTKSGSQRRGQMKFMFWVQNFLDIDNIRAVHAYTGSPTDDGYLSSNTGTQAIRDAVNASSFVSLYNTALANPGYYGLPRRIRLSVSLNF
jgi:hypothetical protein